MGAYLSASRSSTEETDTQTSQSYKYPPKNGGSYFSNHFIMGGEKFDTPQPEAFLFGENSDLNFLGSKPAPFPYPPPQASEPTKTLKSLINIRRDSVHIVPLPGQATIPSCPAYDSDADEDAQQRVCDESQRIWGLHKERKYHLQFTFDSDVRCAVTVYYLCTEDISPVAATYTTTTSGFKSETYYYKRGANQVFNQPTHVIQPGLYQDKELQFNDNDQELQTVIPVAIQAVALDGDTPRQAHTTVASVERTHDGAYVLKNIKQKLFVDGLSYLLQEIYGLENKMETPNKLDDDMDDCGADCVVCMCDLRDTIILPCRHLCLCYQCAESLRYQASNCPICRAPFIALLQIRVVQKMSHSNHPALAGTEQVPQEGVPPGYNSVSLVEALNGPHNISEQPAVVVPEDTSHRKKKSKRRGSKEPKAKSSGSISSHLSSPLTEEPQAEAEAAACSANSASNPPKVKSADTNVRVSLKIVNEVEGVENEKLDIVDEELANMAVAESLNDIPAAAIDMDNAVEVEDFEDNTEDTAGEEGDDEEDEDEDRDDAVVVNLPINGKNPGTPISNSERSSQTSATSSNSTKQLLPKSRLEGGRVERSSAESEEKNTTPVQSESKIVMVVPQNDDDDDDEEATGIPATNEEFC